MSGKYNFPQFLRSRMCGYPGTDHGHTDCWIFGEAAALIESQAATIAARDTEIDRLSAQLGECQAALDMAEEWIAKNPVVPAMQDSPILHFVGCSCGWKGLHTRYAAHATHCPSSQG